MKNRLIILISVIYILLLLTFGILLYPSASRAISEYFLWNSEMSIVLFILIIILIGCFTLTLIRTINRIENDKKKDDNSSNYYSTISGKRKYLEQEIADLTNKLGATDDSWMDINHLLISAQQYQEKNNNQISIIEFLKKFGINYTETMIQKNSVFILTPFNSDYLHTFEIMKETCLNLNLIATRGDEKNYSSNDMLENIISYIVKARIIIANIDSRNPNVFYELGICHALNKPTILIAHNDTTPPFDFKNQFIIFYKNDTELSDRLRNALLELMIDS